MAISASDKTIINNLIEAIEHKDRNAMYGCVGDFFHNASSEARYEFLRLAVEKNIVGDELKEHVERLSARVSENDILEVTTLLQQGSNVIMSKGVDGIASKDIRNELHKSITGDVDLFKQEFARCKYSELKEAIGWVAGFIDGADQKELEKLTVLKKGEINKKQTLKKLLDAIDKKSITQTVPFQNQPSNSDKIIILTIENCLNIENGRPVKKKSLPSAMEVVDKLMQIPKIKNKYKRSDLVKNNLTSIERTIGFCKRASISEIESRFNQIMEFKFYPAGRGEVDVLFYDDKKVFGMSVTSDPTKNIEQNQFFRHALKTLVIAKEINKKYPEGCSNMQARNVAKDLQLSVKIKKPPYSYEKKIQDMKFEELLRYYRQQQGGHYNKNMNHISTDEMKEMIGDMKENTKFIFYGESSPSARPEVKEELLGHLMMSYVLNLKGYGNITTDYQSAFEFLKEAMSAKFNNAENNKNYTTEGLKSAVSLINGTPDGFKRFSEGNCYKQDRELLYNSFNVLFSIAFEMSETNGVKKELNAFKKDMLEFLESNGVSKKEATTFYNKITDENFSYDFKQSIKRIKRPESETHEAIENVFSIITNVSQYVGGKKIELDHKSKEAKLEEEIKALKERLGEESGHKPKHVGGCKNGK